jgi:hypothetical protein
MKGIVADLVGGTHGENGLPCRLKRSAVDVAVSGSSGIAGASIRTRIHQMGRELPPDCLGNR